MPYAPIQLGGRTSSKGVIGTMPVKGTNKRDLPQFLDPNSAQYIENYLIFGQGKMKKRGGSTLDSNTGSTAQSLRKEYRNNLEITGYGTTIKAYDRTAGTFTTIKSDFTASNGGFGGDRYGDYFYVTNLLDGLWRISRTISYSQYQDLAGTNTFTITNSSGAIGATITGGTSGATANVSSSSGTTTLTVIVTGLSGNFTHGEAITSGSLVGATLTNINPFTVGKTLTGATSGATGLILEHSDSGATGTVTLGEISGTFQNAELLSDDNSNVGRGTATSVLGFTITNVSAAPKARYCKVINNRLLLYQMALNAAGWAYSNSDDGTNPPFGTWTVSSGFTSPGAGYYRNGLTVNTADMIGNIIFLGYERGWTAFSIDQTDLGGTLSKFDNIIQTSTSTGIQKVKMTEVGLIACGQLGVKRLVSIGQSNVAYSEQWETLTEQLGEDFFDDADFTDADIDYDTDKGYIFITYKKDSPTHNYVLAIKAEPTGQDKTVYDGATSFITGWSVNNFLRIGSTLYGTSALDGKTYKLFDGETDEGSAIYCQYLQEINFGSLSDSFDLGEFYAAGELTSASTITITFDRYTRTQRYDERVKDYSWVKTNSYASGNSGYSEAAYGSSGYGGHTVGGLVEDFTGANVKLRSNMRVLVRFEANDYSDHTLNWFSIVGTVTTPIRRRTLTTNV